MIFILQIFSAEGRLLILQIYSVHSVTVSIPPHIRITVLCGQQPCVWCSSLACACIKHVHPYMSAQENKQNRDTHIEKSVSTSYRPLQMQNIMWPQSKKLDNQKYAGRLYSRLLKLERGPSANSWISLLVILFINYTQAQPTAHILLNLSALWPWSDWGLSPCSSQAFHKSASRDCFDISESLCSSARGSPSISWVQ